jgi:hypothetical protein
MITDPQKLSVADVIAVAQKVTKNGEKFSNRTLRTKKFFFSAFFFCFEFIID